MTHIRSILTILFLLGCSFVARGVEFPSSLGNKQTSFYEQGLIDSGGSTSLILDVAMNLVIHTYTPIGAVDEMSQQTIITVYRTGSTQPYATSVSTPARVGITETEKACLILENVPSGEYSIIITGQLGQRSHLFVHGYPLDSSGSLSGSERSLAIDAGIHDNSFQFSHQRRMSGMPYTADEDVKAKDLYYQFSLGKPMYVVIDHWGSPLTDGLPDLGGAFTRLHLYRRGYIWTKITSKRGSADVIDSVRFKEWIPEIDISSIKEAAWQGWLSAGDYAVLVENGYLEGSSVTTNYDGIIRTQIHGLRLQGSAPSNPIERIVGNEDDYRLLDSRDMAHYQSDTLYYRLIIEEEGDIKVTSDSGIGLMLTNEGTGDCIQLGTGSIQVAELPTGVYSLMVYGGQTGIRTTEIRRFRMQREGQTTVTPIDVGIPPLSFMEKTNMRYYSNGGTSDINYRFHLNHSGTVVFDHRASVPDTLQTQLRRSDSTLVFLSTRVRDNYVFGQVLAPGTYVYTVSSSHTHDPIVTAIRAMGEGIGNAIPLEMNLSGDKNHIVSYEPIAPGILQATNTNSLVSVSYYDLMGRPQEVIHAAQSPYGGDVGQLSIYQQGLVREQWGPFISMNGGAAFQDQVSVREKTALINQGDSLAFKKITYDNSLLDRVVWEIGAGQSWHNVGKGVSKQFLVNEDEGILSCPLYRYNGYANSLIRPSHTHESWPEEQLMIEKTIDEDGRTTLRFFDAYDKIVMERRVLNDTLYADTYYCYDITHKLAVVIPPEAMKKLSTMGTFTLSLFKQYCWAYAYDDQGRCVQKMEPGDARVKYVYTRSGEVLFTQDRNQLYQNEWMMTVPDAWGRPVLKALVTATTSEVESYVNSEIYAIYDSSAISNYCYRIINGSLPANTNVIQVNWYDDYRFQNNLFSSLYTPYEATISTVGHDAIRGQNSGDGVTAKGMLTGSYVKEVDSAGSNTFHLRIYGYDHYGNQTLVWENNHIGGYSVYGVVHDFRGEALSEEERHSGGGLAVTHIKRAHIVDRNGRRIQTSTLINGDTLAIRQYGYTPKGEIETVRTKAQSFDEVSLCEYNVRGWLTHKEDGVMDTRLFYDAPSSTMAIPQWGGNISQWGTNLRVSDYQGLLPQYDSLNRMTTCAQYSSPISTQPNTSWQYSYDLNGNINSSIYGYYQKEYEYDGNRLLRSSSDTQNITYDYMGRTTSFPAYNMSITYNCLDKPQLLQRNGSTVANYSYLADGTKTKALDGNGNGVFYLGSLIYRKTGNSVELESVSWDGGKFVARRDAWGDVEYIPVVYSTDHLGSVRVARDARNGVAAERSQYTPYGERIGLGTPGVFPNTAALRDHFGGKEDQSFLFGTTMVDFGARMYAPSYGRWITLDPLGEKYYSTSPYVYCTGNPINVVDPQGDSIVVNNWGYILEQRGADSNVYILQDGSYNHIGRVGGIINADKIYSRLLASSIKEYKYIDPFSIYQLMRNKGGHDLKNNKATIYGLANDNRTKFLFEGKLMTSQDIGNHHYGVATNTNVFINHKVALLLAGWAQIWAGTSKPEWQSGRILGVPFIPPYGDDPQDQYWIERGFNYHPHRSINGRE